MPFNSLHLDPHFLGLLGRVAAVGVQRDLLLAGVAVLHEAAGRALPARRLRPLPLQRLRQRQGRQSRAQVR